MSSALERLGRSISAEMTAIESVERRADERRRMRWTVALGFVSTVALPITLVLTFFGINAREVDGHLSMFSYHYLPIYLALAGIVVVGLVLSGGLYLQQRRQAARDARQAAQAMTAVRGLAIVRRRRPQLTATEPSAVNWESAAIRLASGTDASL